MLKKVLVGCCVLWVIFASSAAFCSKEEVKKEKSVEKVEQKSDILKIAFIAFGAALAVGASAWATAYAQSRIGTAGAGAMAEKPELSGTVFILVAIPETMVILGFVIAAMLVLFLK